MEATPMSSSTSSPLKTILIVVGCFFFLILLFMGVYVGASALRKSRSATIYTQPVNSVATTTAPSATEHVINAPTSNTYENPFSEDTGTNPFSPTTVPSNNETYQNPFSNQ